MTREGQHIRTALRAKLLAQRRKFDTFKARAAVAEEHGFELTLEKDKVAASVYRVFRHADSAELHIGEKNFDWEYLPPVVGSARADQVIT
jgi:hypothetical protein